MFCGKCGAQIASGRRFCGSCGTPLRAVAASGSVTTAQAALPVVRPVVVRKPWSVTEKIIVTTLVVVVAAAAGAGWWWVHRPAPPYELQDAGTYPFTGLDTDGSTLHTGFINANGDIVVQPTWDATTWDFVLGKPIACNESMCAVEKAGKWGYIDTSGKLAIPAQFDGAKPFVNGLAPVKLGNLWGYIDKTGRYVVNPQFADAGYFYSNLAAADTDKGWGFIARSGNWVVQPQFTSANSFSEGLASVCVKNASLFGSTAGKCGFISPNGSFRIKPQFDSAGTFSEGLANVWMDTKTGYIDHSGSFVINPQFDGAAQFLGGSAVVLVARNAGIIGRDGKFIVNPGQYAIQGNQWNDNILVASTSDGIGLLSRDGKWVLQPTHVLSGINFISGNVFYATFANIPTVPTVVSISGKVLTGWYKGAMLTALAQDIQNETSALTAMHSLVSAESSYSNSFPQIGFSASLTALGPAANGNPDENHAGLIDATLATGTQNSYQFSIIIPSGTSTGGTNFNYQLTAQPLSGHAGRIFCADSTGTVRYSLQGQNCTTSSPVVPPA